MPSFRNFLNTVSLAAQKYWILIILIVFILVTFLNGVSVIPYPTYQLLAQDPFTTRQDTVLLPIIGYFTSLNSPVSFTGLCLAIILLAYSLFVLFTYRRFGVFPAIIFSTILISNPITTVLLSWLGTPDGLSFLLLVPCLFINSAGVLLVLFLIGTTNHIVFLIAAAEIIFLRFMSREKIRLVHLIVAIAGGIVGLIIVKLFVGSNLPRFDFVFSQNLDVWVKHNLTELPLTILSFFNIQWIIIPGCMILYFKKDKLYYCSVVGILLINYVITFFTLDSTRVFALLSWGILLHCVFHTYRLSQNTDNPSRKKILLIFLLAVCFLSLISPRFYVWNGAVLSSHYHDLLNGINP